MPYQIHYPNFSASLADVVFAASQFWILSIFLSIHIIANLTTSAKPSLSMIVISSQLQFQSII